MFTHWGAHPHSHGHHTQTHPHPHAHGPHHTPHHQAPAAVTSVSGTVPGAVSSGARLDLDSSPGSHSASPSQSPYQMSQMRWLPSVVSTRSHNHNPSLPTISSNLRIQHPHPAQQQQQQQPQAQAPVPMVVDTRPPAPQNAVVGPRAAQAAQQQQVVSVESEESDRSDSPGGTPGTRDVSGADALGEPEFGGDPGQAGRGLERDGDIDMEVLAEGGGKGVGNGNMAHSNLATRKHGKRLTTKEEVFLFEICNRHAADFGQRSNLCKWWMTVTMEFTRGQKHPYSWHSVRRKVELVTKQRMKFLEEQRDKGATEADDLSNPRWRAVVDTWIPTWQRWEEAEARRIEKRDSRRPRKRKWTITTPTSTTITTDQWDLPASSAPGSAPDAWRAPSSTSSSPMVNHNHASQQPNHHAPTAPSATPLSSTPVRLPPGFDTLFSSQPQTQTQPQAQTPPSASASTPFTSHTQRNNHQSNHNNPSTPNTTNPAPPTPDNAMMAAMLETLGKLNKHLDSNSNPNPNPNSLVPNSTPTSNTEPPSSQHPSTQDSNGGGNVDLHLQSLLSSPALSKLKEDIKTEMMGELRTEWDKERAVLEEKLDSVQRTQEMILDMLRQEPS
ncbi:hypothetical protein ASPVEDRAFT_320319 [Aspergillus versicolor CBS 583.65]|uniref:Sex determining protein n=1 Tax=Aspergillus versicolor CBS 583.65 TaxID=1036611 RepID=A0A1L9PY06_ASPVE|nr:uncharacterized protein ASPVEDRAFT_320319 [Aspergillus versicolor CBS 583.65]OJJ06345.1 hypothetical protein ASPVEDRAFT_320319 [Aspergillus versicolor CBS 583.65]